MGKEIVRRAGAAAAERTLQAMMPEMMAKLDVLQAQMLELRRETLDLRKELTDRFDRAYALMSELGIKINTVDTRLDAFADFARRDSDKMDQWLERLVRVEEAQKPRTRRAS